MTAPPAALGILLPALRTELGISFYFSATFVAAFLCRDRDTALRAKFASLVFCATCGASGLLNGRANSTGSFIDRLLLCGLRLSDCGFFREIRRAGFTQIRFRVPANLFAHPFAAARALLELF